MDLVMEKDNEDHNPELAQDAKDKEEEYIVQY